MLPSVGTEPMWEVDLVIVIGRPLAPGSTRNLLRAAQLMHSWIAGIGECRNQIVAAA